MALTNPNIENLMNDGYLSNNRDNINKGQRQRRAKLKRIDYMPSAQAAAIIDGKRGRYYPMNIVSGVIDAIVIEWATDRNLIEINRKPHESGKRPELSYPIRADGCIANNGYQSDKAALIYINLSSWPL